MPTSRTIKGQLIQAGRGQKRASTGRQNGFHSLGVSKPMMAPPATLAPNSMFDSKTAAFVTGRFKRAS